MTAPYHVLPPAPRDVSLATRGVMAEGTAILRHERAG